MSDTISFGIYANSVSGRARCRAMHDFWPWLRAFTAQATAQIIAGRLEGERAQITAELYSSGARLGK